MTYAEKARPCKSVRLSPLRDVHAVFQYAGRMIIWSAEENAMPRTVKTISCCYCDASTLVDLAKIGRGVLTCDACGARLSSARMQAVMNKPVPVKRTTPKRACTGGTLDARWSAVAGPYAAGAVQPKKVSKAKTKRKKRKSFLDRLEDIWDEIEDLID